MKTWKNKLTAIALLGLGYMMIAMENDATVFVLFAIFAIPMFFAKENWIC